MRARRNTGLHVTGFPGFGASRLPVAGTPPLDARVPPNSHAAVLRSTSPRGERNQKLVKPCNKHQRSALCAGAVAASVPARFGSDPPVTGPSTYQASYATREGLAEPPPEPSKLTSEVQFHNIGRPSTDGASHEFDKDHFVSTQGKDFTPMALPARTKLPLTTDSKVVLGKFAQRLQSTARSHFDGQPGTHLQANPRNKDPLYMGRSVIPLNFSLEAHRSRPLQEHVARRPQAAVASDAINPTQRPSAPDRDTVIAATQSLRRSLGSARQPLMSTLAHQRLAPLEDLGATGVGLSMPADRGVKFQAPRLTLRPVPGTRNKLAANNIEENDMAAVFATEDTTGKGSLNTPKNRADTLYGRSYRSISLPASLRATHDMHVTKGTAHRANIPGPSDALTLESYPDDPFSATLKRNMTALDKENRKLLSRAMRSPQLRRLRSTSPQTHTDVHSHAQRIGHAPRPRPASADAALERPHTPGTVDINTPWRQERGRPFTGSPRSRPSSAASSRPSSAASSVTSHISRIRRPRSHNEWHDLPQTQDSCFRARPRARSADPALTRHAAFCASKTSDLLPRITAPRPASRDGTHGPGPGRPRSRRGSLRDDAEYWGSLHGGLSRDDLRSAGSSDSALSQVMQRKNGGRRESFKLFHDSLELASIIAPRAGWRPQQHAGPAIDARTYKTRRELKLQGDVGVHQFQDGSTRAPRMAPTQSTYADRYQNPGVAALRGYRRHDQDVVWGKPAVLEAIKHMMEASAEPMRSEYQESIDALGKLRNELLTKGRGRPATSFVVPRSLALA